MEEGRWSRLKQRNYVHGNRRSTSSKKPQLWHNHVRGGRRLGRSPPLPFNPNFLSPALGFSFALAQLLPTLDTHLYAIFPQTLSKSQLATLLAPLLWNLFKEFTWLKANKNISYSRGICSCSHSDRALGGIHSSLKLSHLSSIHSHPWVSYNIERPRVSLVTITSRTSIIIFLEQPSDISASTYRFPHSKALSIF